MRAGFIGVHYSQSDHRDDFVKRVRQAALMEADVDVAYDEREVRPREIIQLVSA